MSRIGFIGGAYQSQAQSADNQSCINFMVEKDESGAGKNDVILVNTPGLANFCLLPDAPLRGEFTVFTAGVTERAFAVSGSTLYEVFSNGTFNALGAVPNDGKPVSFASSNIQLMIASGGQGFCFTFATNALTAPIATIAGVTQFAFCDTFFAALIGNSAQWFVSNPEDGTTWDPAQTLEISVFPDNLVSLMNLQRYLCFFGKKKSVCYYDSGNSPIPFDVVPGGMSEQGAAATFGQAVADNTIFGIWEDANGKGVAFRANGYTFQRISTHAIENEWATFPKMSDTIAQAHQIGGHTIVQWYFPSAHGGKGATWCYDVATGLWHEKIHYVNNVPLAHPSAFHMFAFGKHLVGDLTSGNIYEMAVPKADGLGGWTFTDDFGNPIIRERISPYVGVAGVWNTASSLEFLMDVGLGPNIPLTDGSGNTREPQIMLSFSKDNGHTWSNERTLGLGLIGQYGRRVIEGPFGAFWGSIGILFKVRVSDPVPIRIVDADLIADPEMPAQKRLAQKLREQA